MKHGRSFLVLALAAGVFAACEDSSGPDGADASVFMSRGTVAAAAVVDAGSVASSIPLGAVDSINVRITSIQAFHSSDSTETVRIDLTTQGTQIINLLNLPLVATDSMLVGRDDLPEGTYNNIRIRFDSATITLNQAVTVGTVTYQPGTYALTIPSGLSSGIKVQGASITVDEDVDVVTINLTFDPLSTVTNIVATGADRLMMNPVIQARTRVDGEVN